MCQEILFSWLANSLGRRPFVLLVFLAKALSDLTWQRFFTSSSWNMFHPFHQCKYSSFAPWKSVNNIWTRYQYNTTTNKTSNTQGLTIHLFCPFFLSWRTVYHIANVVPLHVFGMRQLPPLFSSKKDLPVPRTQIRSKTLQHSQDFSGKWGA